MTIEKRIESDFMKALKNRETDLKNFLGTIKGEMQTLKKNLIVDSLSDEDALKVLSKFAKNTRENISLLSKSETFDKWKVKAIELANFELSILESYLPKQMSESEVNDKLDEIISAGITNIGQIMKEFAILPVDKKLVSELARKKMS